MDKLILSPIELGAFMEAFRAIVRDELQHQHQSEKSDELLTAKEAAALLKISLVTLWQWEKDGRVKKHIMGGRAYYKHSEIMAGMDSLKRYEKPKIKGRAKP